jgi:hypothetical protein
MLTVCILPPPLHSWPSDMGGVLNILSAEEKFLSTLSLCLVTHWFSPHSHHLHDQQFHLPSFSYSEKDYLNLFRLSLCQFLTRPLGFLKLFSNSPLSAFGCLSQGPAYRLAITRTIWSEWTQAWWPPLWVSLVFWVPLASLSRGPARSDGSQNHLIWGDSIRTPSFAIKTPLEGLLGRLTFMIYLLRIYCIFCISTHLSFFFHCSVKSSVQMFVFS